MTRKDYRIIANAICYAMLKDGQPVTKGSMFLSYFTSELRYSNSNFDSDKFYAWIVDGKGLPDNISK